jgi:hypothetical protein
MRSFLILSIALAAVTLLAAVSLAQDGVVSIDQVTNEVFSTSLRAGSKHTVSIRYNFLDIAPPEVVWPYGTTGYWATRNGFEIYSPDGADWSYLQGSKGPLVNNLQSPTIVKFWRHYYFDGSTWSPTGDNGTQRAPASGGVNTRAGYLLDIYDLTESSGFVGGTDNGIALNLEFETLLKDDGRTICIDTSTLDNRPWEWTRLQQPDPPLWDNGLGSSGPRCWEVRACPNMPPDWCMGVVGLVTFAYCQQATYQLCISELCDPAAYALAPPFDNGNYGSVNRQTGLWTWSGPTVPPGGFLDIQFLGGDIGGYNPTPFILHVAVTTEPCDCCSGRVGDANGAGIYPNEVTISDIQTLVTAKFVVGNCYGVVSCLEEGDANQSGGAYPNCNDITISDIQVLVNHLFIAGPANAPLKGCL